MNNPELHKKPLILCADDDASMRNLLKDVLENSGFEFVAVENGRSAIDFCSKHKPDLILLDVDMPVLNGFDACKAIRGMENGTNVPILMVTGNKDIKSIQDAYSAGATDFVTKPINWIIISERIRYMLRAQKTFQELQKQQKQLTKAQEVAKLCSFEIPANSDKISFSRNLSEIFPCDAETDELELSSFLDLFMEHDGRELQRHLQRTQKHGFSFKMDLHARGVGRNMQIFACEVHPEFNSDGDTVKLSGILQDITERKLSEMLETDRNEILHMVVKEQPLKSVMDRFVTVLERQRPEASGAIFLLEDGKLQNAAAHGLSQKIISCFEEAEVSDKVGSCGAASSLGQIIKVKDVSASSFWEPIRDIAKQEGIASSVSVPFFSGKGQVLGTLDLFYDKENAVNEDDIKLVEKLSKMAAVIVEKHHLSELLIHQARHDALTGLLNRGAIQSCMGHSLSRNKRTENMSALLLIDLDRFKQVNDSLGHQVGDDLLIMVSERLRKVTRESDLVGRIGGDEFLIYLSSVRNKEDAVRAAERILDEMSTAFFIEGQSIHLGSSIGISMAPDDGNDASQLQKNADIAMYVAKNSGGNQFAFFDEEMNTAIIERLEVENDLRKAIERKEFELYYQPQYDLVELKLVGLEALIRWNHPERGRIAPDRFIPVAEDSRLIIPLGDWVLREACRQNKQWQKDGHLPTRIAVNVSAVQFMEEDFADKVEDILRESGLSAEWLEIEITETVILKDHEAVRHNLAKLRDLGITTTIDDFGTGYSSITYLRQMPLDCLKIDKSFVRELVESEPPSRARKIIRTFIGLAQNLNLSMVAEGIENIEQCDFLMQNGCTIGQGFYFSTPLKAEEVEKFFLRYEEPAKVQP